MRNYSITTATGETHVLTAAVNVSAEQKTAAADWPVWDSKEDFPAKKQPSFRLRYLKEERVLILEGLARLTPTNGDAAFEVRAGDCVTFHAGFVADWLVLERMRKHYHYFDASGQMCDEPSKAVPVMACDVVGCGKECVEQSFYLVETSEDICPKCHSKARGPDKRRFAAAVPCKLGVPEAAAADKKRKPDAPPASAKRGKA
jgi:uncharacterized cupin superfamily protein